MVGIILKPFSFEGQRRQNEAPLSSFLVYDIICTDINESLKSDTCKFETKTEVRYS